MLAAVTRLATERSSAAGAEDGGRRPPPRVAVTGRRSRVALRTDYGRSPVIWTTIATGMKARQHGIEDFVEATPTGDVPVASSLRKVPALWNMLSRAGRRVAVVGWWASWPAEERGEARARVEAREAAPVDRSGPVDEGGRLQVAHQRVVLDPRHAGIV